jgi:hypothetical protein
MSDLYLIAHKVRGEPAFDIATRIKCPECNNRYDRIFSCFECDCLGYWWIIPTSGHRAYPYFDVQLNEKWMQVLTEMPADLPDHYQTRAEPSRIEQLKAMLPAKPVYRRF